MNNEKEYSEVEKKLRENFHKCLNGDCDSNTVDELMDIIKKDYILLARVPLNCRNCVNYNRLTGYPSDWCIKYQRYIADCSIAYNCSGYLGAEEEARKSIALLHGSLNKDDWIIL